MHWFTFHLPVKSYIKKYLVSNYGDPIILTLNSDIGFIVLNTLSSRLETKLTRGCKGCIDIFQNRYTDKVIFRIPYHYFSITKKEVEASTVYLLNRYFENSFEKEMYKFVSDKNNQHFSRKKRLELFIGHYNIEIETDITADALIKAEYRYRKKITKEFSPILSSPINLFTRA